MPPGIKGLKTISLPKFPESYPVISREISLVKLQSELKINHVNLKLKYSCDIAHPEQTNKQDIALQSLKIPNFLYKLIHVMSGNTNSRCSNVSRRHSGMRWVNCSYKWVKLFKNGPSKICGRQPLKNLKQIIPLQIC